MIPKLKISSNSIQGERDLEDKTDMLLLPSPEDLPDPGIEPASPVSPALAGGLFTIAPPQWNHLIIAW